MPPVTTTNENSTHESVTFTTTPCVDTLTATEQTDFANWVIPPMDLQINGNPFLTVDFPESMHRTSTKSLLVNPLESMPPLREEGSLNPGLTLHSNTVSPTIPYQPVRFSSVGHSSTADLQTEYLVELYYTKFYNAHPFIIPQQLYRSRPELMPPHLESVLKFVGCHFTPGFAQYRLRQQAEGITSSQIPNDGYKVQGLLLLGMTFFACCEQDRARAIINQAIDIALYIGMNYRTFSKLHGMRNAILEESWRRTWWELYMIDGILASLSSTTRPLRLYDIHTDVPLPCEAEIYAQCLPIPPLKTQSDFHSRAFAVPPRTFSSLAYKIESVRLLNSVTSASLPTTTPDLISSLDATLTNFTLSLPPSKRTPISPNGTTDEILFSTHSIISTASILLHRPHSTLVPSHTHNHHPPPNPASESHTTTALKAADSLSTLAALHSTFPSSQTHHSPCFICALALAALVHIPAYSMQVTRATNAASAQDDDAAVIKERLLLTTTALDAVGEVWLTAHAAKLQIDAFARSEMGDAWAHAVGGGGGDSADAVEGGGSQTELGALDVSAIGDEEQRRLERWKFLSPVKLAEGEGDAGWKGGWWR